MRKRDSLLRDSDSLMGEKSEVNKSDKTRGLVHSSKLEPVDSNHNGDQAGLIAQSIKNAESKKNQTQDSKDSKKKPLSDSSLLSKSNLSTPKNAQNMKNQQPPQDQDIDDLPPWDINFVSPNEIDSKMVFTRPASMFDFGEDSNNTESNLLTTPNFIESLSPVAEVTAKLEATLESSIPQEPQKPQESKESKESKKSKESASIELPPQHPATPESTPKSTHTTAPLKSTLQSLALTKSTIPLALKYRPKTFSELIGQDSTAKTLSLALDSKKIANGYLFSGLRGSGKTSSARIFARCLQCEMGISSLPCGICANCIDALRGSHLDIIELDGASNRRIDDMRGLIEKTKYSPGIGRFKVFIIDEVHMLTNEAFNALLKTLEEPPRYVKFIMATTDPLKLPPTILSRTQHFRFKKVANATLREHIKSICQKEDVSIDMLSIDMLIRNAQGSVRDSLTLLDQAIVYCQGEITSEKITQMLGAIDVAIFGQFFTTLNSGDRRKCVEFVRIFQAYEAQMILDEMSVYIKNMMLGETFLESSAKTQDSNLESGVAKGLEDSNPSPDPTPNSTNQTLRIPLTLGMHYANIINDSKEMLRLDCDEEFCLLLSILKMFEVTHSSHNLGKVQNLSAESGDIKLVANLSKIQAIALQEGSSGLEPDSKQDLSLESNSTRGALSLGENKDIEPKIIESKDPNFIKLIKMLYDRDFKIGEFFEKKVMFNGINQNTLSLVFYADEGELEFLRKGYTGIITLVREIFGKDTNLKVDKKPPNLMGESQSQTQDFKNTESKNNLSELQNQAILKGKESKDETKDSTLESSLTESSDHNKEKTTQESVKNFIQENKEMIKNMKDKLGVKQIKVIDITDL